MTASSFLDTSSLAPGADRDFGAYLRYPRVPRRLARSALWIALGVGVAYVLLPQMLELMRSMRGLRLLEPAWVVVAAMLVVLRYPAAAASLQAATPGRIPFTPTLLVQLSSSFIGRLAPEGIGWLVLNQRYLERAGLPRSSALGAITLKLVAGGISRLLIALVVATLVGASGGFALRLPDAPAVLADAPAVLAGATVVGALLALIVAMALRPLASRARAALAPAAHDVAAVVRQPRRALALFATTAALTLLTGLVLVASVAAFGVEAPIAHVFAIYLGGTALAALSPTPGNLGAVELTLSAGLIAIGVPAAAAVGAVLLYRLLTFWIPVLPGIIAFRRLQQQGWV